MKCEIKIDIYDFPIVVLINNFPFYTMVERQNIGFSFNISYLLINGPNTLSVAPLCRPDEVCSMASIQLELTSTNSVGVTNILSEVWLKNQEQLRFTGSPQHNFLIEREPQLLQSPRNLALVQIQIQEQALEQYYNRFQKAITDADVSKIMGLANRRQQHYAASCGMPESQLNETLRTHLEEICNPALWDYQVSFSNAWHRKTFMDGSVSAFFTLQGRSPFKFVRKDGRRTYYLDVGVSQKNDELFWLI